MTDFERVKEATDLLNVIHQETGLKMKGKHLEECPLCGGHECFSIKPNEQIFKCFQCDAGGDIFTFLESYYKIDPLEALKKAAEIAGITLAQKKRGEIPLTTKERIFIEAAAYYHQHMLDNGGKGYLIDKRGHDETVLQKMLVGWTDGGLTEYLKGKGFSDAEIKASGLGKERKTAKGVFLVDFFVKNLAVFPHLAGDRVLHFTIKDPAKKLKYQLPEKARVNDWRFYNQEALNKYDEIILVEGENDLLSILDAGVNNVIATIGQPSGAQIKTLRNACKGKHLYLWLDNDLGGKGGWKDNKWYPGFIRQICNALNNYNIRIIVHSSGEPAEKEYIKDADEYLCRYKGNRNKEIKRLQMEAIDYISWEIIEIKRIEGLEKRLMALKDRKIFAAVADMVEIEQLMYIEKLQTLGLTRSAIEQQLEYNQELITELNAYFENLGNKRDADPNYIAGKMYNYFSRNGRFFYDRPENFSFFDAAGEPCENFSTRFIRSAVLFPPLSSLSSASSFRLR